MQDRCFPSKFVIILLLILSLLFLLHRYRSGKDSEEVNFDADSFLDVTKAMLSSTSLPREGKGASDLDSEEEGDEISGGFMSSEEDDDDDEETMAAAGVGGGGESGRDEEMEEIMEQMDKELGATEVAKSFEKMKVSLLGQALIQKFCMEGG